MCIEVRWRISATKKPSTYTKLPALRRLIVSNPRRFHFSRRIIINIFMSKILYQKKIIIIIKIKNRTNLLSNYIPLLENIAIKSKILDFNFLKKNFTLEHKNLGTKFIHDFLDWLRNFHRLQTIWHLIGIANSRCRKMETPRLSIVAVVKASISFPFVQQWARARKNESGLELDRNVRPVLEAFSIIYLDSRNRYTSCH